MTGPDSEDFGPDANGDYLTWASNATGDYDIYWAQEDGSGVRQLPIAGDQTNPNFAGSLISFEHTDSSSTADLFVWDIATFSLYQLTATPTVDERLNDISLSADGTVRVVYAALDGLSGGSLDVYAFTFQLPSSASYEVCPLFDQSRSFKRGSTAPIKLQLCDATGANLSSAELPLTVTGLVRRDSTATTALAEDAGNANPDSAFRYDTDLAGYVFNLSTKNLARGTWELRFTVTGDATSHAVAFDLR
jgi:hypothetical protein